MQFSAPELLTTKEAANRLGRSAQWLRLKRCTGQSPIPFIKTTSAKQGRVMYRASDIDAFLAAHTFTTSAEAMATE